MKLAFGYSSGYTRIVAAILVPPLESAEMDRIYTQIMAMHLAKESQMLFLAGPRQVGKTTISESVEWLGYEYTYFNWDDSGDKAIILGGVSKILEAVNVAKARAQRPIVIFDELHKYKEWKNFLKGFYDKNKKNLNIIVTGSAKLDIYRKGSDSLMGRYFLYRVHPLTVAEILRPTILPEGEMSSPQLLEAKVFEQLVTFGGYPDPFIKANVRFKNRWQKLKTKQLFREDILELSHINEIALLEQLAFQVKQCCGGLVNRDNLGRQLQVASTTVKYWLEILEQTYYCFFIAPWSTNVSRSILKTPKVYLWDWSELEEEGRRLENLVASHLLKAVHFWTDCGFGEYGLFFLRDKDKNEIDFLVARNGAPWFIVEVKNGDTRLSRSLQKFQQETGAKHAFQVVKDLEYVAVDCFEYITPTVVPLTTFLSQLI